MWDTESTNGTRWLQHVRASFNRNKEISLYIHLPYCESLCTYCGCNKHITKNHLVEKPYIGAVLKEWSLYVQALGELPIIKEIHLGGGTPTFFSPENLELLVKGLKKLSQASENCDMSFEAHPSSTSYEHLAQLRKIGFNRLSVGVQDFDENILRTIHRFQTIKQVRDVVNQARELGYKSVNFDLIYGLPGQTLEHITANMKEVESLKPDRIAFYSYAHVPTVKPGQRAYSEADLPKGREKLLLYQRGKAMLLKMGYADIGMDHFALERDAIFKSMKRKSLHRNFMGYTPYHTELSIGLGASAISDSWTAYAQNEKSVKGYLQQIRESAELPIIKNHFLTEEDQRIRLHKFNLSL
jgi:oxygen-independent coproporphyrinogen-3 oxidase